MAAAEEFEVADGNLAAVAQRQCLVGNGRARGSLSGFSAPQHSCAVNQSLALNSDIMQVFAPYQRVVPMTMAEILIVRVVRLGLVVSHRVADRSRFHHSSLLEPQGDVALQVDGIAEIGTLWQYHCSSALACRPFDGSVDGRRVDVPPVAHSPEIFHIECRGNDE